MKRQTFLIASILPAFECHLLGGPSGAGKTRWIFQILIEWQNYQTVMGFQAVPFPKTMYLAYDRSEASVGETLSSFPELSIPYHSLRNKKTKLDQLHSAYPDTQLFIIDGLATLLPGGRISDYEDVYTFLCWIGDICTSQHITIIGILHASKTKEGESYRNPRQRIAGSVAWAAYSETVFLIEPINPDEPEDCKRRLFICPRNSKEISLDMVMSNTGHLLVEGDQNIEDDEIIILETLRSKGVMQLGQLVQNLVKLDISPKTVERRLKSMLEKKLVDKPKYGYYRAT
jgi:hypothetical protein